MKYQIESTTSQPYYTFEKTLDKNQILDIVVSKKFADSAVSDKNHNQEVNQFINSIKQKLTENLPQDKNIKFYPSFEPRGTINDKGLYSLFLGYNSGEFTEPTQLVKQITQILQKNCSDYTLLDSKDLSPLQDKLSEFYQEGETFVIEKLSTANSARSQNNNEDSSFDGQCSDDTNEDTIKQENKHLKQENEKLKLKIAQLEESQISTVQQNYIIQQQNTENQQLIADQKTIINKFQKEYNILSENSQISNIQVQKQQKEIVNLTGQIQELLNQLKRQELDIKQMEDTYNKNLDEKQKYINKFITYFLIQENKGKCFSNDRVKQRTWEVQEFLKENNLRKALKEYLQIN